ncbi:putative ribosomal rna-processing protein 8 [Erysiphe necator]|uniref:Ribosomal RNA-processing protein 8 n=1 Tax=Uncinula necator TaxID=52586 RepID=A0A0B1PBZ8_UNCNE|nr:putative ribosomal rna-processing protein 8 [Erysiphe necator]
MFAVPGWSISSTQLKTQTIHSDCTQVNSKNLSTKNLLATKKHKRNNREPKAKAIDLASKADQREKVREGKSKKKNFKKNVEKKTDKADSDIGAQNLAGQTITRTDNPKLKESKNDEKKTVDKSLNSKSLGKVDSLEKHFSNDESKTYISRKPSSRERTTLGENNERRNIEPDKSKNNSKLKLEPESSVCHTSLTKLQAAMRQKLLSSRFRYLNEKLYTVSSSHSMKLFQENPEMFNEYHEGFRRQVEIWPENPVDSYVAKIKKRGEVFKESKKITSSEKELVSPLPRTGGVCRIADLGCGDAVLSASLQSQLNSLNLKIFSFDLQSTSKLVTQADIANLPLPDSSIDVAIFCLALMGTNWIDFIEEAFRILRWKGELWVAEIKSRFGRIVKGGNQIKEDNVRKKVKSTKENKKEEKRKKELIENAIAAVEIDGMNDGGEETDVSAFVEVLRKRGFELQCKENESLDLENRMFVRMYFTKHHSPIKGKCAMKPEFPGDSNGKLRKKRSLDKFIEEDNSQQISSEAKVLKPCVYKLR